MHDEPRLQRIYRRPEAAEKLGWKLNTLNTYIQIGKIRKPIKLTPGGRADGFTEDMLIEIQQEAIAASRPRRSLPRVKRIRNTDATIGTATPSV